LELDKQALALADRFSFETIISKDKRELFCSCSVHSSSKQKSLEVIENVVDLKLWRLHCVAFSAIQCLYILHWKMLVSLAREVSKLVLLCS